MGISIYEECAVSIFRIQNENNPYTKPKWRTPSNEITWYTEHLEPTLVTTPPTWCCVSWKLAGRHVSCDGSWAWR